MNKPEVKIREVHSYLHNGNMWTPYAPTWEITVDNLVVATCSSWEETIRLANEILLVARR